MKPAIVLGIDQAARSGWAIARGDKLLTSGTVAITDTKGCQQALDLWQAQVLAADGQGFVWFEDHSDVPARAGRNTTSILGMGASRGHWDALLNLRGFPKTEQRRGKVPPKTWRPATFGIPARTKTERAKRLAVKAAALHAGWPMADDNEAEACGIALWASRHLKLRSLRR